MLETDKQCRDFCPNCGADVDNTDWGDMNTDANSVWQKCVCQKCNCVFNEVYEYTHTEILTIQQ